VFAARGAILISPMARRAWPGVCDGPRRRLSSPSHNAWPENRSTAVPVAAGYRRGSCPTSRRT
jgi:hypothetical protein